MVVNLSKNLRKFNDWVMKCRFDLKYSLSEMAEKLGVLSQDLRAFEMGDEFYLYDPEGAIIPSIDIVNRIKKLYEEKGVILFESSNLKGLSFSIDVTDLADFKDQWKMLVRHTRSIMGISQREFADLIGVSVPSIRLWESNKPIGAPKTSSVFKLASLYGPVQLILNGGN